jgi:hypothetical protein
MQANEKGVKLIIEASLDSLPMFSDPNRIK